MITIGIDGNEANTLNRVGSNEYAFQLLKQFSKYKGAKFLIYLKDKPLPDLSPQTDNFKYLVFGPKKLWTQFALPIKLKFGIKPDVFFSMGHYGPRFSSVPFVVTIHDLSYLHFPHLFKKSDLYQLTSWSKYSINNAKHIIAVSKTTKDDIVKNYKVDPGKISVTYEGYDSALFKPQLKSVIEKVKAKYKISGDYVIFIGTIQPRKNLQRLVDAFSKIITMNYELRTMNLLIAGKKGWLFEPIFDHVKKLGLEKKVIFTDYVPDSDLAALTCGAKVYVLPSLWEGFGIPVIAAQSCGVPVVVSNTSSLPETVGDSGVLVNPLRVESITKGIKEVILDENLRAKLIKRGFVNIKRFSWEKCAKESLIVLEKVASQTTP